MADNRRLLGIDAGMTKTIAAVADGRGNVIGTGRAGGGCIYYRSDGPEGAIHNIWAACEPALSDARTRPQDVDLAVLSASGADWEEDYRFLRASLEACLPCATVIVENDGIGGLWAGSADGTGVSVVLGTGLALGARGQDGRQWHGGFWLQGGGPEDLGHAALRAVVWAELGIGPATSLTEKLLEASGSASVEELLRESTARSSTRSLPVGLMTRLLLDAVEAGDQIATAAVNQQVEECSKYVVSAARRVGLTQLEFPLVGAGGLMRHPWAKSWTEAVADLARAACPGVWSTLANVEPVVGALRLAYWTLGALGPSVDDALSTTHPAPDLFETVELVETEPRLPGTLRGTGPSVTGAEEASD